MKRLRQFRDAAGAWLGAAAGTQVLVPEVPGGYVSPAAAGPYNVNVTNGVPSRFSADDPN